MDAQGLTFSLTPAPSAAALEPVWSDLVSRADCTFYLTWDWIGTWLTTPGLAPFLLSVRDGETVVALALLQPATINRYLLKSRALMLNQTGDPHTDIITIEYNGLLVDRRYREAIARDVFPFLKTAKLPSGPLRDWDEIHFAISTADMEPRARAAGLMVLEVAHKTSWFVDLAAVRAGAKPYLDTLSSNTRHQIRRSMRLYETHGPLEARRAGTIEEAMIFFEEFGALHQQTWTSRGLPGGFSNAYFVDFHKRLIARTFATGGTELVRISAGNYVIGYVYNFLHRGRIHAYQTGLRYDDDAKLKPGLVSHYLCLQQHLEGGALIYDFMAGDNRYKSNLGERGPDMMHFAFQRKRPAIVLEAFLRRVKSALWPQAGGHKTVAQPPTGVGPKSPS